MNFYFMGKSKSGYLPEEGISFVLIVERGDVINFRIGHLYHCMSESIDNIGTSGGIAVSAQSGRQQMIGYNVRSNIFVYFLFS